jgi:hypothetical protein
MTSKSKAKRHRSSKDEEIEGPAKIGCDHVRNRGFVIEIGEGARTKRVAAPGKAWRRLSPLEQAFLRGQLAGGAPKYDAQGRFEAGKRYGEMFAIAQSSGRDSTDMDRISKSGGGASISDSQAQAIRRLIAVESRMSERDRAIVRMVCGQGFFPSEAVRQVCADYRHTIPARLREALDGLVEAFESARRERGSFASSR